MQKFHFLMRFHIPAAYKNKFSEKNKNKNNQGELGPAAAAVRIHHPPFVVVVGAIRSAARHRCQRRRHRIHRTHLPPSLPALDPCDGDRRRQIHVGMGHHRCPFPVAVVVAGASSTRGRATAARSRSPAPVVIVEFTQGGIALGYLVGAARRFRLLCSRSPTVITGSTRAASHSMSPAVAGPTPDPRRHDRPPPPIVGPGERGE